MRKDAGHHDIILDPQGDMERLSETLTIEWGLDDMVVGYHVLPSSQSALREDNWKGTVAIRAGTEVVVVWPGIHQ